MTAIDTDEIPLDPSAVLLNLLITLLAPVFHGLSAGDAGLARMAALETVSAYRARNHADLIAVAQIIGFGLAAVGSLSLSMADDTSASMALRLRGNANACNRSAEQNRRALIHGRADDPMAHQPAMPARPNIPAMPPEPAPEPDAFLSPAAAQRLADESRARLEQATGRLTVPPPAPEPSRTPAEKRHQQMWAIAMVNEASEITASLPNLPAGKRKEAEMRAALLSSTAHGLVYGAPLPSLDRGTLAGMTRMESGGKQPPLSAPAI